MASRIEQQIPPTAALEPRDKGPNRWNLPFTDWNWRHYAFYFGVPAAFSLYAALNNWTVLQLAGYETTILFYAGHGFIPWWTTCLVCEICAKVLAPWRAPQWLILVLGSLLACFATLPYARWVTEYFAHGWLAGDPTGERSSAHILAQLGFWSSAFRATVIWVAVNLMFDRLLGLPRYRTVAPQETAPPDLAPQSGEQPVIADESSAEDGTLRFLQRLPVAVAAEEVIALKAEQHYLRVYTATRSFLTLYRFSDAVAELPAAVGCQVHRSYWVRHDAIRALHRESRKYYLEIVNGTRVPISAANQGMVRELARTHQIPVHPPL